MNTIKARAAAEAAHVRHKVMTGRKEVVEPFMQTTFHIIAVDSINSAVQEWEEFLKANSVLADGQKIRIGVADLNKLGRVGDHAEQHAPRLLPLKLSVAVANPHVEYGLQCRLVQWPRLRSLFVLRIVFLTFTLCAYSLRASLSPTTFDLYCPCLHLLPQTRPSRHPRARAFAP